MGLLTTLKIFLLLGVVTVVTSGHHIDGGEPGSRRFYPGDGEPVLVGGKEFRRPRMKFQTPKNDDNQEDSDEGLSFEGPMLDPESQYDDKPKSSRRRMENKMGRGKGYRGKFDRFDYFKEHQRDLQGGSGPPSPSGFNEDFEGTSEHGRKLFGSHKNSQLRGSSPNMERLIGGNDYEGGFNFGGENPSSKFGANLLELKSRWTGAGAFEKEQGKNSRRFQGLRPRSNVQSKKGRSRPWE